MTNVGTLAEAVAEMQRRGGTRFEIDGEACEVRAEMIGDRPVIALDSLEWLLRMDTKDEVGRLRAERDALLKALVVRAKEGSGAGVLFIPDTLAFPSDNSFDAQEMIAKETGMLVVCGPAEAIEQVEERDGENQQHPFTQPEGSDAKMFIQWKGTDVCLDFHCPCGVSSHYDGDFAYNVRCGACGTVFEMGTQVIAKKVPDNDTKGAIIRDLDMR